MVDLTIADFSATDINGHLVPLSSYQGRVLLVVNVASKCGFTPQYSELQSLYQHYSDRGFVVLAFPCNQFGGQEPGTSFEIQSFCQSEYQVKFPVFEKVEVNGKNAHPLFQWLKAAQPGIAGSQRIKWNFTKFLVDRSGEVVHRYSSREKPLRLRSKIEALL